MIPLIELNTNLDITTKIIDGSPAYIIDNFYKEPKKIADWLFSKESFLQKFSDSASRNGKDFQDKRIEIPSQKLPVFEFLEMLCGQQWDGKQEEIITNQCRFLRNSYNNKYKSHYWWMHRDLGYNGLVYFNDDTVNGTNLYNNDAWSLYKTDEHDDPWIPKDNLKLIYTFKPQFNRFVFFDGAKFAHGMAINDDRYHCDNLNNAHWTTYRVNQVFFYRPQELSS